MVLESRWQQREHEVEEHLVAGEVTTLDDADSFIAYLDEVAGQSAPEANQP